MNMETVATRLEPKVRRKLEKLAEAYGVSLSCYVRLALTQHARTPMRVKGRNRI